MAALVGAALVYAFLSLLRARPLMLVAALCLAAAAALPVVWIWQTSPVAEDTTTLGPEISDLTTFRARTELWEETLVYVRERPWLGYGHDSFWSPKHFEELSAAIRWMPTNAHSNYVDVLLGLGGIGLLIFVCILGVGIHRASRIAVESGNPADLFAPTFLVFCALSGFTETTLVGQSFLTFLYMTAVVRLGFPSSAPVGGGRVR